MSYWSYRASVSDGSEDDLAARAKALLDANGSRRGTAWAWRRAGMWIHLVPPGAPRRPAQGWKLHVSATSRSASEVLAAVMPVLLDEGVAFKFAATRAWVNWLNSTNTPREAAGKFVTVYPADDGQCVRVARACDDALHGLDGPVILSDRPVRPGSLVHYRYGAFTAATIFDGDGNLVDVIHDPDGNPVPDERRPWFVPAAWAADPFSGSAPARAQAPRPAARASAVLLNGCYVVDEVLKHANKGGVYLARHVVSGDSVVIKEARAHVEGAGDGRDAIGVLRHEARLLAHLAHLRLVPRLIEVFEQQGHLFLVLERFDGQVLRDDVGAGGGRRPEAAALRVRIRQLAEAMAAIHGAGVLVRDFTPNNLVVLPDGTVRVVDLELGHIIGDGPLPRSAHGTPGYGSPEQLAGRPSGLPDDYYSLGATIAYVATGSTPAMAPDQGAGRSPRDRLHEWAAGVEGDGVVPERICDLVLGCMADDPELRWSPRQVLRAVETPRRPPCSHERVEASAVELAGAIDDAGRWLGRTITRGGRLLWPISCSGLRMDPCNVQSGASGTGLFLCDAVRAGGDPALRDLVATAAAWVAGEVADGPRRPPGLYFGLAGTAWFLAEAAGVLDDATLLDQAGELALSLPVGSFNPDITHGTAGIGMAQLHHWRLSGDGRFADRAGAAASALVAAAATGPDGVTWPVPAEADSTFAGQTFYGYAHGNAGIACFLLCAAAALDEPRYAGLAVEALETLLRVARVADGVARWDGGPGRPYAWAHWCNGAAGVGSALVRGYTVTRDERYLRLAERAADAVTRTKWGGGIVQCHGLAGGGELLLDLYDATGQRRFRDQALGVARVLHSQRVLHGDLAVFPDETMLEVTASFNTGLAGIGSFLLRLLRGAPRPLVEDELLASAVAARP